MRPVFVFVEGQSDKQVLERLLISQGYSLPKRNVVQLGGRGKLLGRLRGKLREYIEAYGEIVAVVLVDFYPVVEYDTPEALAQAVRERVRDLSGLDLRVHVAVYDLEAWFLGDCRAVREVLREFPETPCRGNPEAVNGQRPPKRVLEEYGYREVRHAPRIAGKLDPDMVGKRCPRFRSFWEELTQLLEEDS